jgi:hypothetical protein
MSFTHTKCISPIRLQRKHSNRIKETNEIKVLDKSSQEPLPYVTLQIKGNRQGAITNIDGYFSILDVPTDTSTILVSYLGYQRTEVFLDPKMSINCEGRCNPGE